MMSNFQFGSILAIMCVGYICILMILSSLHEKTRKWHAEVMARLPKIEEPLQTGVIYHLSDKGVAVSCGCGCGKPIAAGTVMTKREIYRLAVKTLRDHAEDVRSVISPNLLTAIAMVESGGDTGATGKAGEVGLFQFMAAAWEDVWMGPGMPGDWSPELELPPRESAEHSMETAIRFLWWGHRRMKREGRPSHNKTLAAFFNSGNVYDNRPEYEAKVMEEYYE